MYQEIISKKKRENSLWVLGNSDHSGLYLYLWRSNEECDWVPSIGADQKLFLATKLSLLTSKSSPVNGVRSKAKAFFSVLCVCEGIHAHIGSSHWYPGIYRSEFDRLASRLLWFHRIKRRDFHSCWDPESCLFLSSLKKKDLNDVYWKCQSSKRKDSASAWKGRIF